MSGTDYGREPKCEHLESCEMFQLFSLTGTLAIWQQRYCRAEYERCDRHRLAREGQLVPVNLLPNGEHLKQP